MEIGLQKDLFIRDDEVRMLAQSIKGHEEHWWVFGLIMAGSGSRPTEVARIKLSHFLDDTYATFVIKNRKVEYGDRQARTEKKFLPPFVANYVMNYIRHYFQFGRFANGYLFPNLSGRSKSKAPHVKAHSFQVWFCRKRYELGGSFMEIVDFVSQPNHKKKVRPQYRINPYSLRRWCATNFYKTCGDIVMTARMLGHKDTKVTMRYISAADFYDRAQEIINKADRVLNPVFLHPSQRKLAEFEQ